MTRSKPTTQVFPWQKRLLSLTGVAILACVVTLVVYPMISDYRTLDKAAHGDPEERTDSLQLLINRATHSPATVRRMQRKLQSDDDATFTAAVTVLSHAGQFDPASQAPTVLARYQLAEYKAAEHPYVRYHILHEACLMSATDNPPLRELAGVAARDEHPDLRELSAVLAAKVGDIESLELLMEDDVPLVADAAWRCAHLIGEAIKPTQSGDEFITQYIQNGELPDAKWLLVGAEQNVAGTDDLARLVLTQAIDDDSKVTAAQLRAAIATVERLNAPARDELCALIRKRWDPALEQEMTDAARVLGAQVDLEQECDTSRDDAIRLLQQAVMWQYVPPRVDGEPMVVLHTPLASASAALALWRLDTQLAEQYLRHAAANDKTLPGDYIAWHVAMDDPAYAMQLGATMLPRLGAGPDERVYNDNERAAGAMMLALAARNDEEKAFATERITERLGVPGAGEDNPYVRGAYHGALLMLGDEQYRETVQTLLTLESFPQRRALTALLVAQDKGALEWLIWNAQVSDQTVLQLLAGRRLDDVLTGVTSLPAVDLSAPNVVRLESIARLRATYAIGQPADVWTPLHAPEPVVTDTPND
jgi:hypothetical protein